MKNSEDYYPMAYVLFYGKIDKSYCTYLNSL